MRFWLYHLPLPALAQTISGNPFRLDANPLGIDAFRFNFAQEKTSLEITIKGKTEQWAIGLDNMYRITPTNGAYFDTVALRGSWKDETTFALVLIGSGNPYSFEFEFDEKQGRVVVLARDLTNSATFMNGTLEK